MQTFILLTLASIIGIILGFIISKTLSKKSNTTQIPVPEKTPDMIPTNDVLSTVKQSVESEWKEKLKTLESKFEAKIVDVTKNNELAIQQILHKQEVSTTELKQKHKEALEKTELDFKQKEKASRQDAVNKSRAVMNGKMWEHIIPFMKHEEFPYDPGDARFIGAPLDFIIFDGASDNDIKQVVFCEIKTGKSKLNTQENRLKKVVESGNVVWKTISEADKEFKHIEEAILKEVLADEEKL